MRLLIILISIFCTTLVSAQSGSSGTKISEAEKRRLENQFKALNTFYINDDGLVVYQKQSNEVNSSADTSSANIANEEYTRNRDTLTIYVKKNEDSPIYNSARTEEVEVIEDTNYSAINEENTNAEVVSIRKEVTNPLYIKKDPTVGGAYKTESVAVEREVAPVIEKVKEEKVFVSDAVKPTTKKAEEVVVESVQEETPRELRRANSKNSVFSKKPSQYKDMEEAALAVEALLDKLKKEQVQGNNSGSMSSRLSGGAKSTLRRRSSLPQNSNGMSGMNVSLSNTSGNVNNQPADFGDEPTYYLNGVEVDKEEITKLKKKEIINREIRTRNTASGNPNGEVWYQTKGDDL